MQINVCVCLRTQERLPHRVDHHQLRLEEAGAGGSDGERLRHEGLVPREHPGQECRRVPGDHRHRAGAAFRDHRGEQSFVASEMASVSVSTGNLFFKKKKSVFWDREGIVKIRLKCSPQGY